MSTHTCPIQTVCGLLLSRPSYTFHDVSSVPLFTLVQPLDVPSTSEQIALDQSAVARQGLCAAYLRHKMYRTSLVHHDKEVGGQGVTSSVRHAASTGFLIPSVLPCGRRPLHVVQRVAQWATLVGHRDNKGPRRPRRRMEDMQTRTKVCATRSRTVLVLHPLATRSIVRLYGPIIFLLRGIQDRATLDWKNLFTTNSKPTIHPARYCTVLY